MNSGIPIKKHLYKQVILSNQNEANYNLTNSPFGHFGTKTTWPVWKYIPGPKIKLLPNFVTKGQRVKQSKTTTIKITPPNDLRKTRVNRVI
jgi:hypothetical protein